MAISRRQFLKTAGATAALVGLGGRLGGPRLAEAAGERVLVVVNLRGGNDGLGSIVPLREYDRYRELRPTLGHDRGALVPLAGVPDFAMSPGLAALQPLFAAGRLAIVNGMGVPVTANGLFDHDAGQVEFQTCDLLRSGPVLPSGWLGRWLDGYSAQIVTPGVDMGGGSHLLRGATHVPLAIESIDDLQLSLNFDEDERRAAFRRIQSINSPGKPAQMNRRARLLALDAADAIAQRTTGYVPAAAYPPSDFSFRLEEAAKLVNANLGIRAIAIDLDGFDTHSGQEAGGYHRNLLADLATSLAAFHQDLAGHGHAGRVLVLTISEFGRRAYENSDGGTDHGLGSTAFVLGNMVRGGVYGAYPGLGDDRLVLDGNLATPVDFRSVYSTVVENYLGADSVPILGGRFPKLAFV